MEPRAGRRRMDGAVVGHGALAVYSCHPCSETYQLRDVMRRTAPTEEFLDKLAMYYASQGGTDFASVPSFMTDRRRQYDELYGELLDRIFTSSFKLQPITIHET